MYLFDTLTNRTNLSDNIAKGTRLSRSVFSLLVTQGRMLFSNNFTRMPEREEVTMMMVKGKW